MRHRGGLNELVYEFARFVEALFGCEQQNQRCVRLRSFGKVRDFKTEIALRFSVSSKTCENVAAGQVQLLVGFRDSTVFPRHGATEVLQSSDDIPALLLERSQLHQRSGRIIR